ncbi:MAG: GGDEF domain-containing protein [Proteobacteria bacterium]|nr:GGDEF domain-containing protein [Pseudomonadota bacterium]
MTESSDQDIKTRVTTLDELRFSQSKGDDWLVVIYSPKRRELGKRYLLRKGHTAIGREQDNDIVLENDSVSRRHCRIERDGETLVLLDLQSTNGTFVNDDTEPIARIELKRGDQVKIGNTIFKYLCGSDVESQYHETIYRMTITDGLTTVHNKRFLSEVLEREIPRAHRHGRQLSLLMIDIDHFKEINDTYGHLAGDAVLRDLALLIKGRLRPDDVLGRYGGEEFAAVLPETGADGAGRISEELRRMVEEHSFTQDREEISVTVSIGVAQLRKGWQGEQLFRAADEMLYAAKREGRNRVRSAATRSS